MNDEDIAKPGEKIKGRSPAYPAINLRDAADRAKKVWTTQSRHPAAMEVIGKAWGYGAKSGGLRVTLSALLKFGLLERIGPEGARQFKLTQDGQIIGFKPEGDAERAAALKRCALLPSIYTEIWNEYSGELPPTDDQIIHGLVLQRGFSESAAGEVVSGLRETIAFAKLVGTDKSEAVQPSGEDELEEPMVSAVMEKPPTEYQSPLPARTQLAPQQVAPVGVGFIAYPVVLPSGERGSLTLPQKSLSDKDYMIIKRQIIRHLQSIQDTQMTTEEVAKLPEAEQNI